MAPGDVYVVYEEQGGWTVMRAEGQDFEKYGSDYYDAIAAGKEKARSLGLDLVVNYKDGRTGRYYYQYNDTTGELEQT